MSNFWHQTQNAGGQISVDGLNYYPFQFPGRDGGDPPIELDLDFTDADLPEYWDVNKPHKEMRAFPLPSGGLIFPSYYNNGNAAYMDTTLSWNELAVQFHPNTATSIARNPPLRGQQRHEFHSLHVHRRRPNMVELHLRADATASQIEEWEFQANGELDLFILNVRYQSTEGPMWTPCTTCVGTPKTCPPTPSLHRPRRP